MRYVELVGGEKVPALGLGTWKMGIGDSDEAARLRALQAGIAQGMTLIDTAEMYGEGRSEQLVAKAMADQRDKVFVVSKVLPQNASRLGTIKACEAWLRPTSSIFICCTGAVPIAYRIQFAAFEELRAAGKIRHYGVSNFDVDDLGELNKLPGGHLCRQPGHVQSVGPRH